MTLASNSFWVSPFFSFAKYLISVILGTFFFGSFAYNILLVSFIYFWAIFFLIVGSGFLIQARHYSTSFIHLYGKAIRSTVYGKQKVENNSPRSSPVFF